MQPIHAHVSLLVISAAIRYLPTVATIQRLFTPAAAMELSPRRSRHAPAPRSACLQQLDPCALLRSAFAATTAPIADQVYPHLATCKAIRCILAVKARFPTKLKIAHLALAQATSALVNVHARSRASR